MNFWIALISIGFLTSLINGKAVVKIKILNNSTCSAPARQEKPNPTQYGLSVPRGYYPWHAAIFKLDESKSEYICGGTLISSETVLTAAHCVHDERSELLSARTVLVKFDVTHLYVDETAHYVHDIIPHEHFNDNNFRHDIALLKLRTKVIFTDFIRPACLTNANFNIFDVVGSIAAFGQSTKLHEVDVPGRTLNFEDCKLNIKRLYDDYGNFCAEVDVPGRTFEDCKLNIKRLYDDYVNFCVGYIEEMTILMSDSGTGLVFNHSNIFTVRGILSLRRASSKGIIDPTNPTKPITIYAILTNIQIHYKWIVDQMDVSERNESSD